MTFLKEPDYAHGKLVKTAVVLINLGTPDAPTPNAVKRYLKQFLWDQRVVEIPRAVWWMILNFIILPFRSKKSAEKYASPIIAEPALVPPIGIFFSFTTKFMASSIGVSRQ